MSPPPKKRRGTSPQPKRARPNFARADESVSPMRRGENTSGFFVPLPGIYRGLRGLVGGPAWVEPEACGLAEGELARGARPQGRQTSGPHAQARGAGPQGRRSVGPARRWPGAGGTRTGLAWVTPARGPCTGLARVAPALVWHGFWGFSPLFFFV
ncbi:hypothetical protein Taro_003767 [Colocasia esculenta]|uniref:Uncharacterized protein n=1 Tax=Colocasia esculenta TaxID=4460 RepID=A0A843TPM8_COLES|nr:hypothetical protein [Colocasia esculenta]